MYNKLLQTIMHQQNSRFDKFYKAYNKHNEPLIFFDII